MADIDPRLIGTIDGLTIASWGTGGAGASCNLGYIYKVTLRRAGEDDKVFSGSGFTKGVIFFDDQDDVDIELLAKDAAVLPARGNVLAVGDETAAANLVQATAPDADLTGYKGIIFDAEKAWEYKGWKMITLKATQFVNLVFAAA